MNRRLFTRVALAVCALASVPAFAQNKVVMGVAIPAATHGWTGMGVHRPRVSGLHPADTAGNSAAASSQSLRRTEDMLPLRASRIVLRC